MSLTLKKLVREFCIGNFGYLSASETSEEVNKVILKHISSIDLYQAKTMVLYAKILELAFLRVSLTKALEESYKYSNENEVAQLMAEYGKSVEETEKLIKELEEYC